MSGADDEWVKAAMTDDTMVVELLVRLHSAGGPPPVKPAVTLPLEWSVRQRRSKPVNNPKKKAQRASPTTPLSWSGATSHSGGSGGSGGASYEESSRPPAQKPSTETRSKINGNGEKSCSKRSRKKKTVAELKDEESSLQKERGELKREIAALHANLEKQRDRNDKLKRMKVELLSLPDGQESVAEDLISDQLEQKTTCHPIPAITPPILSGNYVAPESCTSNRCLEQDGGTALDPKFVLPDLNIPFDENPVTDVI